MSPRMDADFDWGDVQASTPIYEKGDYEIVIRRVRSAAWYKKDKSGNQTTDMSKVIRLAPEIVGRINSLGELETEYKDAEGRTIEIAGKPAGDINLWMATKGGQTMSKRVLMAICGFDPTDDEVEKQFNRELKESGLNLSIVTEEDDEGKLQFIIGDGYEKMLVNKHVRCHMEPRTREEEGRDPIVEQDYRRFWPVNPYVAEVQV